MYSLEDLFNIRAVVGAKLERLIDARSYTKSEVCSGAKVSRPTLDKILNGEINNKINFEKHISKILDFFSVTPSELAGAIENPSVDFRRLRQAINMSMQKLSEESGVSISELQKIEAGENIPLIKLRDVAFRMQTSVRGIQGHHYFQTQIATMEYFVENNENNEHDIDSPGGYWGHVGILADGVPKYKWFPISEYTKHMLRMRQDEPYTAIPCLDNTLLIINNRHITEMVLLDEACDAPDMDWDENVSCGEIPGVIYEALDDYQACKDNEAPPEEYDLSQRLFDIIDMLVSEGRIQADGSTDDIEVTFSNGRTVRHNPAFEAGDGMEEFESDIRCIFETGEMLNGRDMVFRDENEMDIMINMENVSLIKLPLSKTEDMIYRGLMEGLAECGI